MESMPLLVGLVMGLRHAFEPDHLAAVAQLSARSSLEQQKWKSLWRGISWGIGHGGVLLLAVLVARFVGVQLPAFANTIGELLVGVYLVVVSVAALLRATNAHATGTLSTHTHRAGAHAHRIADSEGEHVHIGNVTFAVRPLLVGALHGFAGSGALLGMWALSETNTASVVWYTLNFVVGSTCSMGLFSYVFGEFSAKLAQQKRIRMLTIGTSVAAMLIGGIWIIRAMQELA